VLNRDHEYIIYYLSNRDRDPTFPLGIGGNSIIYTFLGKQFDNFDFVVNEVWQKEHANSVIAS